MHVKFIAYGLKVKLLSKLLDCGTNERSKFHESTQKKHILIFFPSASTSMKISHQNNCKDILKELTKYVQ